MAALSGRCQATSRPFTRRTAAASIARDRLEFNLPVLATALALSIFVWETNHEQPWEKEAMYLGRTR